MKEKLEIATKGDESYRFRFDGSTTHLKKYHTPKSPKFRVPTIENNRGFPQVDAFLSEEMLLWF